MRIFIKFVIYFIVSMLITGSFAVAPAIAQDESHTIDFIQMTDEKSGWILLGHRFFFSADAGVSWEERGPNLPAESGIHAVKFLSSDEGWVLWTTISVAGDPIYNLSHTVDQGFVWDTTVLSLFEPSESAAYLESASIDWLNSETGWIVIKQSGSSNFSNGTMFFTHDGGMTWNRKSIPVAGKAIFVNSDAGWLVGGPADNQIFYTKDSSQTWNEVTPNNDGDDPIVQLSLFLSKGGKSPTLLALHRERFDVYIGDDAGKFIFSDGLEIIHDGNVMISGFSNSETYFSFFTGSSQMIISDKGVIEKFQSAGDIFRKIIMLSMSSSSVGWGKTLESNCELISLGNDATNMECRAYEGLAITKDGGLHWEMLGLPTGQTGYIVTTKSSVVEKNPDVSGMDLTTNARVLIGQGFDKCEIPTLTQLQTWFINSPYSCLLPTTWT